MHKLNTLSCSLALAALLAVPAAFGEVKDSTPKAGADTWEAPAGLAISPDGAELYVACAKTGHVLVLDADGLETKRSIAVSGGASGLALSADGKTLYVTCAAPLSHLAVVDAAHGKVIRTIPAGHTAQAPVLSPDGATVYVCNRFSDDISVINVKSGKETGRIPVDREPVAAAPTPDGKYLLVANHLHHGRADTNVVAAKVSVIDVASRKVTKELILPNGSGMLREIQVSPDGRYAGVVHVLARYQLPTTQLERGWMNTSALSLIDLSDVSLMSTILLDNVDSGAANPWAVAWSADSKTIYITHAGTHELSVIDFTGVLQKLAKAKANPQAAASAGYRSMPDITGDLSFLAGLRERVKLAGKGPRASVTRDHRVYVADYFSGSVERVDAQPGLPVKTQVRHIEPNQTMSILRRGESLFNDATICFQGWQSCASCHSDDARSDGLNWDLLNDGIGNPKNSKSLLLSHRTPPAMSMGVRDTAETAVRSGIRSILFTVQPEEIPVAMDEWLKSMKPIPSPYLVNGKMSSAAKRGETIFNSAETHCASCHTPGLYTDMKHHDVGTGAEEKLYDTPTLVEIWRTSPYLHDGSAVTIRDVLTSHNSKDRHGKTSHLTPAQLDDLAAYLLSL